MPKVELTPTTFLNPMPVVLAGCRLPDKPANLITLAWAGIASSKPPSVSIAIRPSRYSFSIISETREFVIAVPDESMIEAVDYCGCISGREVDKFSKTGLTAQKATKVDAPLVGEAPINMECKVSHIIDLGVHHLFIGEIVALHVESEVLTDGKMINNEVFKPVVYSFGAHEYRAIGKTLGTHGFARKRF